MKNGKIIIIETKGGYLDGSDSLKKLRLSEKVASKSGDNYRYFMVFDQNIVEGAKTLEQLVEMLMEMN